MKRENFLSVIRALVLLTILALSPIIVYRIRPYSLEDVPTIAIVLEFIVIVSVVVHYLNRSGEAVEGTSGRRSVLVILGFFVIMPVLVIGFVMLLILVLSRL